MSKHTDADRTDAELPRETVSKGDLVSLTFESDDGEETTLTGRVTSPEGISGVVTVMCQSNLIKFRPEADGDGQLVDTGACEREFGVVTRVEVQDR